MIKIEAGLLLRRLTDKMFKIGENVNGDRVLQRNFIKYVAHGMFAEEEHGGEGTQKNSIFL